MVGYRISQRDVVIEVVCRHPFRGFTQTRDWGANPLYRTRFPRVVKKDQDIIMS